MHRNRLITGLGKKMDKQVLNVLQNAAKHKISLVAYHMNYQYMAINIT
ncbi:MAG: hypothetical protein L3J75_16165 [Methylococcaceae bacterium]|nr:hypothetical protein [Methylococcaceae bacterium]